MIDKDKLKQELTIEQVFDFVAALGGNPQMRNGYFISQTICHNPPNEGSYKLYYYANTQLFKCYTSCGDIFDIYDLYIRVQNVKKLECTLYQAITFVAAYMGMAVDYNALAPTEKLNDWSIFEKYDKIKEETKEEKKEFKIAQLKTYDNTILGHLPKPRFLMWEKEGITQDVMQKYNIAFNPLSYGIVIPHYDIYNNLIGIRERTLIKSQESLMGKYRPSVLDGTLYTHPLGFNLFNINNSKQNIFKFKTVIIGEGEKFCLTYESLFGKEQDITVAVCGSSLSQYQVDLLLFLGVKEIVIAFDKQFKEIGDNEWKLWTKKLKNIHTKYGNLIQISYMFDLDNLLDYKDSPIDKGRDIFLKLFKERISV